MNHIYHEKQQERFCAQHCLNSLLQGPYFTLESLLEISHGLDDAERITRQTVDFHHRNNDESGDFSVQVINQAIQNFGLEMVPYLRQSPQAEAARKDPTSQRAFICHFDMHWLAIRRLGNQWFDLNSLHSAPRLISNTYLKLFLAQLTSEHYLIWFISGNLPECAADEYILRNPVPEVYASQSRTGSSNTADVDEDLELALEMSRREEEMKDGVVQSLLASTHKEAEDAELQAALKLSMQMTDLDVSGGATATSDVSHSDDDPELKEAIRMSLEEPSEAPSSVNRISSTVNDGAPSASDGNKEDGSVDYDYLRRKRRDYFSK